MTKKLYENDAYQFWFQTTVVSCVPSDGRFLVRLTETAFVPEGGGQKADSGTLDAIPVEDVYEKDEEIFHVLVSPVPIGKRITGSIDGERRLRHMQHHTGEHILSGTLHRLFGAENVGFHLGHEVTLDTDIPLSGEQLKQAEEDANRAVREDLGVEILHPSAAESESMAVRSKIGVREGIRVVRIPGVDACVCCAPHVSRTGEVGMIKITDFLPYKGGTRIFIRCGRDAWRDYDAKQEILFRISRALSVPVMEADCGVERLMAEAEHLRGRVAETEEILRRVRLDAIPETREGLCLFYEGLDARSLRKYAEEASAHAAFAAVLTPDGNGGHRYALAGKTGDMRALSARLHATLGGRGGGNAVLTQGAFPAGEEDIRNALFS